MEECVVDIKDLHRSFGAVKALGGLSLEVERGKVVGLLGPNGAGKTTCLRILIGLLRPDSGNAVVLGKDPWSAPPEHRRRIGFLSEEGFPWPKLSFRRAVAFTSSFFPSWDGDFVEELAGILQVPLDIRFGSMSRGERRKAALALVLGPRPELLLLDDPASGLDPVARREMITGVVGLLRRSEATILFSSHILTDVERLADEVCMVVGGKMVLHLPLDVLKSTSRRLLLEVPEAASGEIKALPEVVRVRREESALALTVLGFGPGLIEKLGRILGRSLDGMQESPIGLEDLYIDLVAAAESGWKLQGEPPVREGTHDDL